MINPDGFCIAIKCQNSTVVCSALTAKKCGLKHFQPLTLSLILSHKKFIHYNIMYCKIDSNAASFSRDLGDLMVVATS